ncbi:MAG: GNAT family N-acetyltransferase [Bacteroidales bacterium]|jgi:RimJ/RimL family protein N-acetyltransferase|nr:GNAT family N-acetyltransferase [Bacteroidales bacterium]
MKQEIFLCEFTHKDFENLISWVNNEKELIQFAGPIFSFPLTKEQLNDYLKDPNRYPFKIVLKNSNLAIGHCEVYKTSDDIVRLCRIIIGNKTYRGQGLGYDATLKLIKWCMDNLKPKTIDLNVYDFNTTAIKCYEKIGFKKTTDTKETTFKGEVWTSIRMTLQIQNLTN